MKKTATVGSTKPVPTMRRELARDIFKEIDNILSVNPDGLATLKVSELYAIEKKYTEE